VVQTHSARQFKSRLQDSKKSIIGSVLLSTFWRPHTTSLFGTDLYLYLSFELFEECQKVKIIGGAKQGGCVWMSKFENPWKVDHRIPRYFGPIFFSLKKSLPIHLFLFYECILLIQENLFYRITTTWNKIYQKLQHFCHFESAWKVDHRISQKVDHRTDLMIDFFESCDWLFNCRAEGVCTTRCRWDSNCLWYDLKNKEEINEQQPFWTHKNECSALNENKITTRVAVDGEQGTSVEILFTVWRDFAWNIAATSLYFIQILQFIFPKKN